MWVKLGDDVDCLYCGLPIPKGKRHIDHIIPLAMGGLDSTENIGPACVGCNLTKHTKHPLLFLAHKASTLLDAA